MRAACAAALLLASSAGAAGAPPRCTVEGASVQFGRYDPFAGAPLDSVGTLTYTCTGPAAPEFRLGAGRGGTFDRRMFNGAASLRYNLFLDPGHTRIWGDGTGGAQSLMAAPGSSGTATVFARIPPGQKVPAGTYSDVIVVTVVF